MIKELKNTNERKEKMNCPKCGREIRPTDKFCIACGAKLENHGEENENFNAASMRKLAGETVNHAAESLMGTSRNGIDFMVRRYFFGFGDFIAVCDEFFITTDSTSMLSEVRANSNAIINIVDLDSKKENTKYHRLVKIIEDMDDEKVNFAKLLKKVKI